MGAAQNSKQLACTTCAKAKSRCIPGPPDSGKCERCNRLGKPCLARSPAPPRPKTQTRRSRVADLEKRLTELSSHFQGGGRGAGEQVESPPSDVTVAEGSQQRQSQMQTQQVSPVVSPEGESRETSQRGRNVPWRPKLQCGLFQPVFPPGTEDEGGNESAWPTSDALKASSARAAPTGVPVSSAPWPVGREADEMLERYHRLAAHLSPFVVVPRDLTSNELRVQRPFLWKGVMMACTYLQGTRQRLVGEQFLEEISRAAFGTGETSLDVLQGLLLLVSWYHHSLKSTRMVSILFLARSMCLNLELGLGGREQWLERLGDRDLDHLRAYAGTYYLNTVAFTTNKRVDVFMHTSYLESCCTVLETVKREPSDALLVQLVRVQQIAQSIALTVNVDPSQQVMQLPLMAVVQSFQSQLESLRQSLPPELKNDDMLITHISITEVLLGEVGLSERHCQSNLTPTDRLRVLWYCLRSLRGFFDIRCKMYPAEVEKPRFLCMRGLDVTYALLTAGRLVTLKLPGWDLDQIERDLRFWEIFDWLIDFLRMMTAARKEAGAEYEAAAGSTATEASVAVAPEDSLERLLRVAEGLKVVLRQEISRIKQDNSAAAGVWYPSPERDAGLPSQDGGDYEGDLWKDMIDDYQWDMVGEFQWL